MTEPTPYQQFPQKKGMSTTLKVVLIVLGVFTLLGAGCVAVVSLAANDVVNELEELDDKRAADEALIEDNTKLIACDKNSSGYWKADVEFTNPLDEEKGYFSIEINFLDPDGAVIGDAVVIFENLKAGQKAKGEAISLEEFPGVENITCEVVDGSVL